MWSRAQVELHSAQYDSVASNIESKIREVLLAQREGARQQAQDVGSDLGGQTAHPQHDVDSGPPNYHLGTPPRERTGGEERGPRVHKVSLDKLGLKVLGDESKYRTWVKSLDMAMDDIWVGLEDVLRLIKSKPEPMTPEEFGTKLDECRLRPPDCCTAFCST